MRDQFGLVPPEIRAMVEADEAIERQVASARYLDKALKDKDPNLGLVFIKEVPEWELPVGAVGGRWHVQVKSPTFVTTYIPIQGPNGEFREPASDVLDMVDRADLTKPDIFREVVEAGQRKKEAQARATQLKDEQARDEMVIDFKAAKRVAGEGGLEKKKWGKK